ncbi:beta-class carbonic anhydrase [Sediminibacillus halophilus]|uniref:carbonic anhydrase n=1 Tax=Sediminibacillus halophilus TaxID=482461 RepID=A0A1G9P0W8_9BACI|nr:carbonic anhydrase [Sediminibacillus halophilus]SDL92279.1 carbonic anhydrase [Sediminibacillus halophilus]
MKLLEEILAHNEKFVGNQDYEKYQTDKFPNKRAVIISCMDTRLVELLPQSMNIGNGDAKVIKTAGAIVGDPFGSVMQSILVAVYELKADEVFVVGHHNCGMSSLNAEAMLDKVKERGVSEETLATLEHSGVNLDQFLQGFDRVEDSVKHSVETIKHHPMLPSDVPVHGLVIAPDTGKLDVVVDGYQQ